MNFLNPNIGKSKYKSLVFFLVIHVLLKVPTYITTVGYNSVVNIMIQIQAADRQNLEANAKMLVMSSKLVVEKKYAIVMPIDVTDVEKRNIIAEYLRPKL